LGLTVCVDEVAASGGYLMACVADRIVASPFAMLGSIGVISTMPNFYERLKREGVEVRALVCSLASLLHVAPHLHCISCIEIKNNDDELV
jgi:multisubunit Na+/H+ antiporter MnhG subunit